MPKILAVDDSATMRRVLELTFHGLDGFEVVSFDSGDAAVRHAQQAGADLVIADASMSPDGYDLCSKIKGAAQTAGIPVLILGSQHTPIDADKAKSVGADDTFLKPYDTNAFIEKAKTVIAGAKKAPQATAATYRTAPVASGPAPAPVPAAASVASLQSPPGVIGRPSPIGATMAAPGGVAPAPAAAAAAAAKPVHRATASFGAPTAPRPPLPLGTPASQFQAPPSKRPVLELAEDDEPIVEVATPASSAPIPAAARSVTHGSVAGPAPVAPAPAPVAAAPVAAAPVAAPAPVAPSPAAAPVAAAAASLSPKLEGMGLTAEQMQGVLALTKEVIERVVWEVVPDLAETIIREEIKRLTK